MLIKYSLQFFIISCVLLTNNYIVKAEVVPLAETPTSSEGATSSPEGVTDVTATGCTVDGDRPCVKANNTLLKCNSVLETPDDYVSANIFNGTYEPDQKTTAACTCNQEFHEQLTSCISCFNNSTKAKFEVAPVDVFKSRCKEFGIEYTEKPPDKVSILGPRVKIAIATVAAVFLLIILGLFGYKCFVKRRGKGKDDKNRDSLKALALSSKENLHDEPLMWKNGKIGSMSNINESESKLGEYDPQTISQRSSKQTQLTTVDYHHQQQNYYPTSSNLSISNMQIPTQSGEIPYYPPPESPSNLNRYAEPQDNNTFDGYHANHNNGRD